MKTSSKVNVAELVALITGATGYVGAHLARRLVRDGWNVHIVVRDNSRIPQYSEFSSITSHVHDGSTEGMLRCVANAKPDVVFHLASKAQAQHEPKDVVPTIQTNVLFASQLLEGMRINGITKFVNTGTYWQHFNNEGYNPVCLYAATKQALESILEYYVQACNIRAVTLNLFDIYGPNDPRPKLPNLLKKAAITGVPLDMSQGEQLIELVYIDDVVDAYVLAASRLLKNQVQYHERYAVSSGCPIRLRDLVERFSNILSLPISVNWGARPYRPREVMVPWNRGVWLEGWRPCVGLEDGLLRLSGTPENLNE